jgi:DNA-binding beta-propeller fold protein YncE
LAVVAASAATPASAEKREYLYVENSFGGDVTIISIPEHEVVGTIPASKVGRGPDDVAATPDGRTIFINRLQGEDVVAIDTRTEEVLFTVPVGGIPHHMTMGADGRHLYVPLFDNSAVKIIDVVQRKVVGEVPISMGAHATRLSPDGKRLYVGHMWGQSIMIIDLASNKVVKTIEFDKPVRPFEISPDEKILYVQTSGLSGFHVVDIESGAIRQTVYMPTPLPAGTKISFPHTVDHGLALTKDGKRLLAAGAVTGKIAVFSVPDMKVVADIKVGVEPNWITLSKDERFAYVSNRRDDTVSVISLRELRELKRIPTGDFPQRMKVVVTDRGRK